MKFNFKIKSLLSFLLQLNTFIDHAYSILSEHNLQTTNNDTKITKLTFWYIIQSGIRTEDDSKSIVARTVETSNKKV